MPQLTHRTTKPPNHTMSNVYKLRGRVKAITEPRTFASGFTMQELVVEDESNPQYPQNIAVGFGGDRIQNLSGLKVGQEVEVTFGIRGSTTPDGRHFVNLRGWGVATVQAAPVQTVAPIGQAPAPAAPPAAPAKESLEDLPF